MTVRFPRPRRRPAHHLDSPEQIRAATGSAIAEQHRCPLCGDGLVSDARMLAFQSLLQRVAELDPEAFNRWVDAGD